MSSPSWIMVMSAKVLCRIIQQDISKKICVPFKSIHVLITSSSYISLSPVFIRTIHESLKLLWLFYCLHATSKSLFVNRRFKWQLEMWAWHQPLYNGCRGSLLESSAPIRCATTTAHVVNFSPPPSLLYVLVTDTLNPSLSSLWSPCVHRPGLTRMWRLVPLRICQ